MKPKEFVLLNHVWPEIKFLKLQLKKKTICAKEVVSIPLLLLKSSAYFIVR
jgi:hypothetical protein